MIENSIKKEPARTLKPSVVFDIDYLCALALKEAQRLPCFRDQEIVAKAIFHDLHEDMFLGIEVERE